MADMNDNLDDSIPFINITHINFYSLEKLKQKLESHDFQKHVQYVILTSEARNKTWKPEGYLDDGVLYAKDNQKVYISMKAYIQDKQLDSSELSFGSNCLDLLFSKLANAIEITTPKTWNNISFYFHDIVEDHHENLIPDCRRKYGIEWFANCITIWRLVLFFGYFVFTLVKQIITFRRSSL
ncbi:MAG: hypothetical protein ACYTXI_42635 [Nostoc sp.]